jgi:spore coat polysaccharide biosynthesis predicted glycosyltransferase SpsG
LERKSESDGFPGILVTFGGSDPVNVSLTAIHALQRLEIKNLSARVVVGPSNPRIGSLKEACRSAVTSIKVIEASDNMADLMAWADIAISASGSTCWELAYMGLPAITIILADNQKGIAEGLDNKGVVINMGWYEYVNADRLADSIRNLIQSFDLRVAMGRKGRNLIDGNGAERIVKEILKFEETG